MRSLRLHFFFMAGADAETMAFRLKQGYWAVVQTFVKAFVRFFATFSGIRSVHSILGLELT